MACSSSLICSSLNKIADKEDEHSWPGPGHCSLVRVGHPFYVPIDNDIEYGMQPLNINSIDGSASFTYAYIYHGWMNGHIGAGNPRKTLLDVVVWDNQWPTIHGGASGHDVGVPSERSKPIPTTND
jgi:hypothetical protein